jgi:hypothetical protein
MTVTCDYYKRDDHESVKGTTACDLHVGQRIVKNVFPGEGRDNTFLDISEISADTLLIRYGRGENTVWEQFHILRSDVLQRGN